MLKMIIALLTSTLLALGPQAPAEAHGTRWPCAGPITVAGNPGGDWRLGKAVRVWNRQEFGQPKFRRVDGNGQVTVIKAFMPTLGYVGYWQPLGQCSGIIVLNTARNDNWAERASDSELPALREWITLHELGHTLGLPHNTRIRSVMSTNYNCLWREGAVMRNYDRTMLAHVYGEH